MSFKCLNLDGEYLPLEASKGLGTYLIRANSPESEFWWQTKYAQNHPLPLTPTDEHQEMSTEFLSATFLYLPACSLALLWATLPAFSWTAWTWLLDNSLQKQHPGGKANKIAGGLTPATLLSSPVLPVWHSQPQMSCMSHGTLEHAMHIDGSGI